MKRFWRLLKSLTKIRWRLLPPRQSDVLLYFKTGADVIAPYFSAEEFQILDVRESEVNITVALKCALTRDISAKNYAKHFIKFAKPKLILTFIDNFPAFYTLKNEFPQVQIWLIQNGIRSERGDLFGLLKTNYPGQTNHVDKLFVFGTAVGEKYLQHISGKVIVHGSFKNNLVPVGQAKKDSVAYISTYRPQQKRTFVVPESSPESPVTYDQIIERREKTILWLAQYCKVNRFRLTVIGKDENPKQEDAYYRRLLKSYDFEFAPRESSTSSYEALERSDLIVFTSSSLGYEALARGKKTAALLLDAEIIGAEALKFGWPAELLDDGKFWTHQLNETRFNEIMEFLRTVNEQDWEKIRGEAMQQVIQFDQGNSKFLSEIKSLRQSWR